MKREALRERVVAYVILEGLLKFVSPVQWGPGSKAKRCSAEQS